MERFRNIPFYYKSFSSILALSVLSHGAMAYAQSPDIKYDGAAPRVVGVPLSLGDYPGSKARGAEGSANRGSTADKARALANARQIAEPKKFNPAQSGLSGKTPLPPRRTAVSAPAKSVNSGVVVADGVEDKIPGNAAPPASEGAVEKAASEVVQSADAVIGNPQKNHPRGLMDQMPDLPTVDPGALAKAYCSNIGQAAGDARIAWQAGRLRELETQLANKTKELSARLEEARAILEKRDAVLARAEESVVAIYAKMKPESAAAQIAVMHEDDAAAILSKLSPRSAGGILNEMPADKAARLANGIAMRRLAPHDERKAS